jgi:hypothetical protein
VRGVPTNQEVFDNVEEFRFLPRGLQVRDAVYARGDGRALRASALVLDQICVGVVTGLIDQTWCRVLLHGVVEGFGTGLVPNTPYFLSPDAGKLTTTPPSTIGCRVQQVGLAINSTDLLISPDLRRMVVVAEPAADGRYAVRWNPAKAQFDLTP